MKELYFDIIAITREKDGSAKWRRGQLPYAGMQVLSTVQEGDNPEFPVIFNGVKKDELIAVVDIYGHLKAKEADIS